MKKILVCEDCDKSTEDNWAVYETLCPYSEEILEEEVPVTLCSDCKLERSLNI